MAERRIAALFVEAGGSYSDLPEVDLWDQEKDARLYPGTHPVVAHPPCNRWCKPLAFLNQARFGHQVGDDGGCFASALESVRRWGGILEHPAYSAAWDEFQLPRPGFGGWTQSLTDPGWTSEVDQWAYGHPAAKKTWLYYIGPNPPTLRWISAPPGLPYISLLNYKSGQENRPVLRGYEASRTPLEFRDELLAAARSV